MFQRGRRQNPTNQNPPQQAWQGRGQPGFPPHGQPSGNPQNPYYIAPKDSFKVTTKRTRFIEFLMIFTPILIALVFTATTFQVHARDNQKLADILQVVQALRLFYSNSSNVEGNRSYPIALDSRLNEVDYEYTLRRHLTGQTALDRHVYIQNENYPTDPWGIYSQSFTQREVPYNRLEKLPFGPGQDKYLESYPSCNLRLTEEKYARCYLYTSAASGESFSLAYYSEVHKGFIVYTEARNNADAGVTTFMTTSFGS